MFLFDFTRGHRHIHLLTVGFDYMNDSAIPQGLSKFEDKFASE